MELRTRGGTLRGLVVTGGVITAASIMLARTFAAFPRQRAVEVTEVGIAVTRRVLLDTPLVRTIVVPATLLALGEPAWWPTRREGRRPKRGGGW